MRKHIPYIIMAALALLSAFACNRVDIDEQVTGKGYLYVSLDRDPGEELIFKSANVEDYTFSLKIYDSRNELAATVDDCTSLQSEPLELNVGTYTLVASSAEAAADAAFDAPFYSGTAEFTVAPETVTNVDVTCTLANVKVTTTFSDEVKAQFPKYSVTVSNGSAALTFSNEDGTADKEGYFSATGTLIWTLLLENTDGQQYTALTDTYTDVKARQHYNISFALKEREEFGGSAITVIVNNELTEKEYDITLNFGDETLPEITDNFGYVQGQPAEFNAGDATSKVLTLTTVDGFRNIYFTYVPTNSAAPVQIDLVGASATAISDLAAQGIAVATVETGAMSATIDITEYIANQPIGDITVSLLASDVNGAYTEASYDFVLRSPVETEAVSADAWAMFATLKGKWFASEQPDGIAFMYKKSADTDWIEIPTGSVTADASSRTYTAEIRGIEPETEYVFKAVSTKDKETKEMTFTTESAGTIHNMNFDNWYQDGKAWMPNLDSSYKVWDSANPGSASFGYVPTQPTSDVAVSGDGKQAVKMETMYALVKLAAGNIYTGEFGGLSGMNAYLDWGTPFTSRPLALRGYYKYQPVAIDRTDSPYDGLKCQIDTCQIQMLLTDWDAPFTVNTATGSFVDFDNDEHIIAYGKMETAESSDTYQQFEIKLDYRDLTRIPKYVVITACASKYGDFFTGGVGSTLYVDEFEFVYNPDELK